MQYLYLALLAFVFLISGCNHSDRVVELINEKYPKLKEGGSIEFVSYRERHNTKWAVRTFRAEGVVKFKEKWFVVKKEYQGRFGVDDIIVVSQCNEINNGLPFTAFFYKGRTSARGDVRLNTKNDFNDFYTKKTLEEKYKNKCLVFNNNYLTGKNINSRSYKKKLTSCLDKGEKFIEQISLVYSNCNSQVSKLISIDFKGLNDDKLSAYLSTTDTIYRQISIPEEMDFDKNDLLYFMSFPLENFGQTEAKEMFLRCKETEENLNTLQDKLKNLLSVVKKEKEIRSYKKKLNSCLDKGEKFVEQISLIYSNYNPQVSKLISIDFNGLNDDKLNGYLSTSDTIYKQISTSEEADFDKNELLDFMSFSEENIDQTEAREMFLRCKAAEESLNVLKNKLKNIMSVVRNEKEMRSRRGVKFLPVTCRPQEKENLNKIEMVRYKEKQKNSVVNQKNKNDNLTLENSSQQSIIIMPLKNNDALPSNGQKDTVVPVTKPMTIIMPR